MVIAGYVATMAVGISLGLIGGGGSILTIPILVYLFGISPTLAITYSLFVVAIASITGTFTYFRQGLLDFRTAIWFAIPSTITVLLTRILVVPSIPDEVLAVGSFTLTKDVFLLLLFALLMIFAALKMVKTRPVADSPGQHHNSALKTLLYGSSVGVVTGLVGAGGGFLIIPILVNLFKLPMKKAVGTSLFIISINSLTGFFFSTNRDEIDWKFLFIISMIAIAGIVVGSLLSTRIQEKRLKEGFGWFVLALAIFIIVREAIRF